MALAAGVENDIVGVEEEIVAGAFGAVIGTEFLTAVSKEKT